MKTHLKVNKITRELYKYIEPDFKFAENGNIVFENLFDVRIFAQKVNDKKDLVNYPEKTIYPSEINAVSLIHDVLDHIMKSYISENEENLTDQLMNWIEEKIGAENLDDTFKSYIEYFPPPKIQNSEITTKEYLNAETDGIDNKKIIINEMLNLWLLKENPALTIHSEFFRSESLDKKTEFMDIMDSIKDFFVDQPKFGPKNQNIVDMLLSVSQNFPNSLEDQLLFIQEEWSSLTSDWSNDILLAISFYKEEHKYRGLGPGEAQVLEYFSDGAENYSIDSNWMPKVVMIAKNTYVWLDQLSKTYGTSITRLDQIPKEEIKRLADFGYTALWLIGLWKRSIASKTIKKWTGNPEALSSAYSIIDYLIDDALGGYEAYNNLKNMAWEYGIRLASDMVPNHTSIDSSWVMEHPNWFISLPYPPFPAYKYSGDSLSTNPDIGIFLEDHYFDRTDAAVTFKWRNNRTGEEYFIYHGNDGTSMPWNDTAQLNYLESEVRETIIQTIIQVAKMFPIIRFDAAMTLARKHIQRLWYPEPGHGGDIPSRGEYGMPAKDFIEKMPKEFWREVVDRVKQEVPDTLLLAEAFWMLEGFFVRTLGMHRVYNSAFMNMLRDEDNAKYRLTMKNTLEYDPEILKRFVNFMNNPDEETAIKQFGSGDKYFGICVLLSTMPGLPMFGHGQLEGFAEKYGMEYKKAYWDEEIDDGLMNHHQRVIFPLLRKRYLFAEVKDFLLYDFYSTDGNVNEDVFAYSNRLGNEKSLVIYNNRFANTKGWIKTSVAFLNKAEEDRKLVQHNLGHGLGLNNDQNHFVVLKELVTGLEYLRKSNEIHEKGLYFELGEYKYIIFLEIKEIKDTELKQYEQLYHYLNGKGVPNVKHAMKTLFYKPIHDAMQELLNTKLVDKLKSNIKENKTKRNLIIIENQFPKLINKLLIEISKLTLSEDNVDIVTKEICNDLKASFIKFFNSFEDHSNKKGSKVKKLENLINSLEDDEWSVLYSTIILKKLGKLKSSRNFELLSRSWIDEWQLSNLIENFLLEGTDITKRDIDLLSFTKLLIVQSNNLISLLKEELSKDKYSKNAIAYSLMKKMLSDPEVQDYLKFNRYLGQLWLNKERIEHFLRKVSLIVIISSIEQIDISKMMDIIEINEIWVKALKESNYEVNKFLEKIFVN